MYVELQGMLLSYADACSVKTGGVVSLFEPESVELEPEPVEVEPESVELSCASASGTIYGIDGGTKSMLTRKIPKNTVKLFFLVTYYGTCLAIKRDRFFQ